MTDGKIYKLIDLIEEIKKADGMIALHKKNSDSDFMLLQYEALKLKLTSSLINELNSPPPKSVAGFFFMKQFLDKYFADSSVSFYNNDVELNDLKKLEAAL